MGLWEITALVFGSSPSADMEFSLLFSLQPIALDHQIGPEPNTKHSNTEHFLPKILTDFKRSDPGIYSFFISDLDHVLITLGTSACSSC